MKFHLLPDGEKFEYQDDVYIKVDKLIANSEKTGQNRLIPRSANVQPVNAQANTTPNVVEEHQVQTAKVLKTFDDYHQCCLQCLSDIGDSADPDIVRKKMDELEAAHRQFVDNLLD